jgi:hypothetical protein
MDFVVILEMFKNAFDWAPMVLSILGSLVVLGSTVDKMVPDKYDKGFMSKLYNMPIVGHILKALVKFSWFSTDVEQTNKPK